VFRCAENIPLVDAFSAKSRAYSNIFVFSETVSAID